MSRDAVVENFSLRILLHQPLGYAEAVGRDFIYGFAPVRGAGPEKYSPAYLQFHTYILPDPQADASIGALGYRAPAVRPAPAAFLTDYGRWFYVPGPVFAAGLLLGLAGLVVGKRRGGQERGGKERGGKERGGKERGGKERGGKRRGQPGACRDAGLLFTASAVLVLVPAAAFATFDWRYQLPQLTLIPVAAILGLNTIMSRPTSSSQRAKSNPEAGPKEQGQTFACGGDGQDAGSPEGRPRPG
jgi:hypothetical protein